MTHCIAIITVLSQAALFEVAPIPLHDAGARVFLTALDEDDAAEIGVIAGGVLRIYDASTGRRLAALTFPGGTAAFDVVDIDEDGRGEVVAIAGDRVAGYELDGPAAGDERLLFRIDNLLGRMDGPPAPYVLAVREEEEWLLAIPRQDALELRTQTGEVRRQYPVRSISESPAVFERPFMARTVSPTLTAPAGALELHVDQVMIYEPSLPAGLQPDAEPLQRRGSLGHARNAESDHYRRWPWFPLLATGGSERRVLYALTNPDYEDTLVRIQQPDPKSGEGEPPGVDISPARRYRGSLAPPRDALPDFNGDGFTDILLWTTPHAGRSVDALTRALYSQTWPVELRVHCFNPEKNRYESGAAGAISARVPLWRFVHPEGGTPLHQKVVADFNGDGRTDLAFSTGANEYCAWVFDDGFPRAPSFKHAFPDSIVDIEQAIDLDGSNRVSIVLRGEKHAYVLKAAGTAK